MRLGFGAGQLVCMGFAMGIGSLVGVRFAMVIGSLVRMRFPLGAGCLVRMGFVGGIRCSVGMRFDGGTARLAGAVRLGTLYRALHVRSLVGIRPRMLVPVVTMMMIVGQLQAFDAYSVLIDHQPA